MIKLINSVFFCILCVASFYVLTTPKLIPYRAPPEHVWKISKVRSGEHWYKSAD